MQYYVIYETGSDGAWSAYAPDLPRLGVTADTYEAVRELIREGMSSISKSCGQAVFRFQHQVAKADKLIEVNAA